jgi:hypothetical protein
MENLNFENKKFKTPEEELSFLKEYILNKERELSKEKKEAGPNNLESAEKEEVARRVLESYETNKPEDVLAKGNIIPEKMRDEIVLKLSPEAHDQKMAELISMVYEKGISNTLDIVLRMNNPHLADDFHRFLVQYLKSGYQVTGLDEKTPLAKSLKRTLFEVTLTYNNEGEKDLQSFLSWMEQFYSGMASVSDKDKQEHISLEITNALGSREFIFYISVPDYKTDLLEKQIISIFSNASVEAKTDDFNTFFEGGYSIGAYLKQKNTAAQVIKTYEQFSSDPMKVILNVFSKLDKDSESATIQLILKPTDGFYIKNYKKALERLEKGEKGPEELYVKDNLGSRFSSKLSKFISGKPSTDQDRESRTDNEMIQNVQEKIKSPVASTNWRIVVSSPNKERSESIFSEIQSAFNQFENTQGNKIEFFEIGEREKKEFFKKFSFRDYDYHYEMPLNYKEISTMMHLPFEGNIASPELKTNKMKTSPAPLRIPEKGLHLGTNIHRGNRQEIYYTPEDRLRHFYVIGQTGTGKTNILKNMIVQDIKNGDGACFIDPHGSDVQDILANIPEERYEDLIYFDPSYIDRPMALNMLEYDHSKPQQKIFVVNELFSIFQKLYSANPESMGPMFEQYFRNAAMLVVEDPDTGSTLLEISRVLSDKKFRDLKVSRCKNPVVVQFWQEVAGKAGGEASLENIVPYIVSKFDVFLANDIMRPIIAQEKSSFNFRQVMDQKKILLVNLSKGSLGDMNSSLIGLILVGKILMAALSRADTLDRNYPPFYLYIDEFQNVTTDSISTILSEARKYRLSLNVAHQFIAQLDEKTKNSVFGNVGSMAVHRVGSDDADYLESQYAPIFSAKDIMNIDNYNCYIKLLSGGVPIEPFSMKVPKAPDGKPEIIESLKQLSYLKYGGDKAEIEQEILDRYKKAPKEDPIRNPFGV